MNMVSERRTDRIFNTQAATGVPVTVQEYVGTP